VKTFAAVTNRSSIGSIGTMNHASPPGIPDASKTMRNANTAASGQSRASCAGNPAKQDHQHQWEGIGASETRQHERANGADVQSRPALVQSDTEVQYARFSESPLTIGMELTCGRALKEDDVANAVTSAGNAGFIPESYQPSQFRKSRIHASSTW
jgi:hypothetical protein